MNYKNFLLDFEHWNQKIKKKGEKSDLPAIISPVINEWMNYLMYKIVEQWKRLELACQTAFFQVKRRQNGRRWWRHGTAKAANNAEQVFRSDDYFIIIFMLYIYIYKHIICFLLSVFLSFVHYLVFYGCTCWTCKSACKYSTEALAMLCEYLIIMVLTDSE